MHTVHVTTATSQHRLPSWRLLVAVLLVLIAAAAALSIAGGSRVSGGITVQTRPLMPGRLSRASPTAGDIQRAFAAAGLTLVRADDELLDPRWRRLSPYAVGAFRLDDPSSMLIVVFDRAEPRAPMQMTVMPQGFDTSEASGRVYVEYRAGRLDAATAAQVRRAFRLAA